MDLDHIIDFHNNCGDDGGFGKENEGVFSKGSRIPQKYLEARIPNAPESLDTGNIGWKFQLRTLGRW